jgi:hypothetical protein
MCSLVSVSLLVATGCTGEIKAPPPPRSPWAELSLPDRAGTPVKTVLGDAETYAVYAAVLESVKNSGDKPIKSVSIRDETESDPFCGYSKHSKQLPNEWQSLWPAYEQANASIRTLRRDAHLGLPYVLVKFEDSLRYQSFPSNTLHVMSAVGFDPSRTRAMVTVQHKCGLHCAGGGLYLLLKEHGRWVRADIPSCSWMS